MRPENGSASPSNQGGTTFRQSKSPEGVKGHLLELVIAGLNMIEAPLEIAFWQIHGLRTRLEMAVLTLRQ